MGKKKEKKKDKQKKMKKKTCGMGKVHAF